MKYEKQYINLLISESVKYPEIKPILEEYLLDNIDFETLTIQIEWWMAHSEKVDFIKYRTFKKSIDIDGLLGESI